MRSFTSDPRGERDDPPDWNPIFILIGEGIGGRR